MNRRMNRSRHSYNRNYRVRNLHESRRHVRRLNESSDDLESQVKAAIKKMDDDEVVELWINYCEETDFDTIDVRPMDELEDYLDQLSP